MSGRVSTGGMNPTILMLSLYTSFTYVRLSMNVDEWQRLGKTNRIDDVFMCGVCDHSMVCICISSTVSPTTQSSPPQQWITSIPTLCDVFRLSFVTT